MSNTEKRKKVSIGVEDFKTLIEWNGYFVDKTLMIRELIESNAMVTLFTRPRRFGKTLNQFMIRRFFEDEITEKGEKVDNRYLFDGLAITGCGEEILKHQQRYPVIFMTLKSAKQDTYALAYMELKKRISEEYKRHKYVLQGETLTMDEKKRFEAVSAIVDDDSLYTDALGFLSACLAKYHGHKTIILIDEYDVPLENAYLHGFYEEMIGFIRSLFESALKTNPYLEKGVITGCLRISKESIFTGLNNMEVQSILSVNYPGSFGFTEPETQEMMAYFGLSDNYAELKRWYDGYCFGGVEIYNPWSILNYIRMAEVDKNYLPRPYWSNSSSNSIIREMVGEADEETRTDLETLINGGTIEKRVHEDITYGDIHQSQDNLWNFLFFTGYLKKIGERKEQNKLYLTMKIPNLEIASIYEDSISYWFDQRMKQTDRSPLLRALESGDCQAAEDFINRQLMDTISYFDHAESFYHGFLAGLLTNIGGYRVKSNRESGNGRPDIVMQTPNIRKGRVILLELKLAASIADLEAACGRGLAQIETQRYAEPFTKEGYPTVLKYAVSFYKKDCMVQKGGSAKR